VAAPQSKKTVSYGRDDIAWLTGTEKSGCCAFRKDTPLPKTHTTPKPHGITAAYRKTTPFDLVLASRGRRGSHSVKENCLARPKACMFDDIVGLTARSKKLGMLLFPKRNTSSENLHHPKTALYYRFLPKNYTTWSWRPRQRWQPLSRRKLLHTAVTTSLGRPGQKGRGAALSENKHLFRKLTPHQNPTVLPPYAEKLRYLTWSWQATAGVGATESKKTTSQTRKLACLTTSLG
jgi:hypothetical protein